MSLPQLWLTFQCAHLPPTVPPKNPIQQLQFDSPFLINYVAYHHYRSLGWVVKGGIKFCVDYLLYKRGPVFSHAEWVKPTLQIPPSLKCALYSQVCCRHLSYVRGPSRPRSLLPKPSKCISIHLVLAQHNQPCLFPSAKGKVFLLFYLFVDQ
jgi:hypothetical protein